jgi:hypothetical protein
VCGLLPFIDASWKRNLKAPHKQRALMPDAMRLVGRPILTETCRRKSGNGVMVELRDLHAALSMEQIRAFFRSAASGSTPPLCQRVTRSDQSSWKRSFGAPGGTVPNNTSERRLLDRPPRGARPKLLSQAQQFLHSGLTISR